MSRQHLDEEKDREIIDGWYETAKKIHDLDSLMGFVSGLLNKYKHDYGTICHAVTAATLAAAHYIDHDKQGGITGFQASQIGMMFINKWMHINGPWRMVRYENMLYPQYENYFNQELREIDQETLQWLQERAREILKEPGVGVRLTRHLTGILEGQVPFGFTVREEKEEDN
jgi:hypothetical protein